MSLLDDFNKKIIEEYKSGNSTKRVFLQTIKAALIKEQKDSSNELSADDEIAILKKELKVREQSKADFQKGERDDLVKNVDEEIALLKEYLPEELSDEKITEAIKAEIAKRDNPNFGEVMGAVMATLKGQADGSKVSQIVKENLNDQG